MFKTIGDGGRGRGVGLAPDKRCVIIKFYQKKKKKKKKKTLILRNTQKTDWV